MESFEPMIGDILPFAERQQCGFCKYDIGVTRGTLIRMTIANVHNHLIISRSRQQMVALAICTFHALFVRMSKSWSDRTVRFKDQLIGIERKCGQLFMLQHLADVDIKSIADNVYRDRPVLTVPDEAVKARVDLLQSNESC